MQIPIKLWLLILVEKMEEERACNPLTLQVAGRESVWWARSGSVSTNQTIQRKTLGCSNNSQGADFPVGHVSDQRSFGLGMNRADCMVQQAMPLACP